MRKKILTKSELRSLAELISGKAIQEPLEESDKSGAKSRRSLGRPANVGIPRGGLSVKEFALRVGRSETWIRKLVSMGQLVPSGFTPDECPWFKAAQVEIFDCESSSVRGPEAAKVFGLLKKETPLEEIVILQNLEPWKVEKLSQDYARLSKAIYLRGEEVDAIMDFANLSEDERPTRGESIVQIIRHEQEIASRRVAAANQRATTAEEALRKTMAEVAASVAPAPEGEESS